MKAIYIIMILAVIGIGVFLTNYLTGGGGGVPGMGTRSVTVYVRSKATIFCQWKDTQIQDVVITDEAFCIEDSGTSGNVVLIATGTETRSVAKGEVSCSWAGLGGVDQLTTFKLCLKTGTYNLKATWEGTSGETSITVN